MDSRHLPGQRLAGRGPPTSPARPAASCRQYPEVEAIVPQIGRPDDGTDPSGFNNVEIFVPLRPEKDWPVPPGRDRPAHQARADRGHERRARPQAARHRLELLAVHPRQRHGGALQRHAILLQVDTTFTTSIRKPVNNALVEVITAQVRITIGTLHFKDTIASSE